MVKPCGRLIHFSKDSGVDWALVEIDHINPHSYNSIIVNDGIITKVLSVEGIARTRIIEKEVIAMTGAKGLIRGILSRNSTYLRTANAPSFQELWTIRMESHIGKFFASSK